MYSTALSFKVAKILKYFCITFLSLNCRTHGQVPSWCWLDVHWMDTPLFAVLLDGQSFVLPPLFSSAHVQLHAIRLAPDNCCVKFNT